MSTSRTATSRDLTGSQRPQVAGPPYGFSFIDAYYYSRFPTDKDKKNYQSDDPSLKKVMPGTQYDTLLRRRRMRYLEQGHRYATGAGRDGTLVKGDYTPSDFGMPQVTKGLMPYTNMTITQTSKDPKTGVIIRMQRPFDLKPTGDYTETLKSLYQQAIGIGGALKDFLPSGGVRHAQLDPDTRPGDKKQGSTQRPPDIYDPTYDNCESFQPNDTDLPETAFTSKRVLCNGRRVTHDHLDAWQNGRLPDKNSLNKIAEWFETVQNEDALIISCLGGNGRTAVMTVGTQLLRDFNACRPSTEAIVNTIKSLGSEETLNACEMIDSALGILSKILPGDELYANEHEKDKAQREKRSPKAILRSQLSSTDTQKLNETLDYFFKTGSFQTWAENSPAGRLPPTSLPPMDMSAMDTIYRMVLGEYEAFDLTRPCGERIDQINMNALLFKRKVEEELRAIRTELEKE